MASTSSQDAVAIFDPLRQRLVRVAYRMLGSVADAEDVLQDAFLRWLDVDQNAIREPEAFLRRVVMRLCLDRLKSVRRRREIYVGQWLPEPVVESEEDEIEDVTLPLMMALERLSPLERAAFLLHDVFGLGFDEVATTIGRESATCARLASRARSHIRADRPRYVVTRERGLKIAQAFFAASRDGELGSLRALLAADVTLHADGGGKAPARKTPAAGVQDVMRLFETFASVYAVSRSRLVRFGIINGLPGFVTVERGEILQTTALEIGEEGVIGIYIVRNPDKLRHMTNAVH
jgi:RNA polymerase sigma-70 factor (ECF subfamily)